MTPFWLYQCAFGLQLVALALFLAYAAAPRRELALAASSTLGVAALIQVFFTVLLGLRDKAVPLGNAFEALNFFALIFSLLALRLEWRWKLGLLGAFLLPFSSLLLLMGIRFHGALPPERAPFGGLFLFLHVGLPMAGYALFAASAGLSAAFLMEERQIKRGHMGGSLYTLPSLAELESLAWTHAAWGLAFLGLGVLAALLKDSAAFTGRLSGDPKASFTLFLSAAYGGALLMRPAGLRGRRFALVSLLGFVALFLGFYLVNVYMGGHGGFQ